MVIATTATPIEPKVSEHDWKKPAAMSIPKDFQGYTLQISGAITF